MKRLWVLMLACLGVLLCLFVVVWSTIYSDRSDPKNLKYILWKNGLYPLDPDVAVGTMIADPHRDTLVIGKSRDELTKKFGFLTPIEEASDYDKRAASGLRLNAGDRKVFVLRRSTWLVVVSQGRASQLVLVKGS